MIKKVLILLFTFSLLSSSEEFKSIKSDYFKSYDYEQVGKYKEAIKILSPLYKKYPNGYTLNLRLAWLFYLQKKYNDSTKYYKKASLINTNALDPKLGLIRVYLATYSYEEAQNVSTELLKIDYYNYYANFYMAKALIGQKKYKIAIKLTDKMLTLYPTDILFLEQLLISYKATKSKSYKEIYESILILDPNNVLVRNSL
jgi:tetratricopeptide (TPR) repeat protein